MSSLSLPIPQNVDPDEIPLAYELRALDLCVGADPFVFFLEGLWYLLLQEDTRQDPLAHDSIRGLTLRSATTLEGLATAAPRNLLTVPTLPSRSQVWAPEIHFHEVDGRSKPFLYVATSLNGVNASHRMRVFQTMGDLYGPWDEVGELEVPTEDNQWSIDLTILSLTQEKGSDKYAVWSGWEDELDETQHLYIAKLLSPTKVGARHRIITPEGDICCSEQAIVEGAQAVYVNNDFRGLTISANASWTTKYAQLAVGFNGNDPLLASSWKLGAQSLLPENYGIGHGMVVQDGKAFPYIGHRKKRKTAGWEDRVVFTAPLQEAALLASLG